MKNMFLHPERSLTAKLVIAIGLLIIIVSLVFWYVLLKKQEKDLLAFAVKYGNSIVEFIKESTTYSMLTYQQPAIQHTLKNLSSTEGISRIIIFDHKGKIFFSSEEENIKNLVDKDSVACKGCHVEPQKSSMLHPDPKNWAVYKDMEGSRALKVVGVIYNEPSCYTAECHVHPENQKILGFIEADMSLAFLDTGLSRQRSALTLYVVVFIMIISMSLGIILYKIVSSPVNELVIGMKKVSEGDLDYTVSIKNKDEIGILAETFNHMKTDIKAAREKMEQWTRILEEEVAKKTEEIQKTHAGLLQTEKLASLGRMAAGVAHEINNPLTGIVTFAHLMKKRFPPDSSEAEDLDVIIEQAERCAKIIKNLLTFARATPSEKGHVSINDILSRTIFMIKNQEKFHKIKFDISIEDSSFITLGDASQLQQIFLNMLLNAADAMNERGTITVATREKKVDNKSYVEIEFTDTGCGIMEEDMPKLFEPFFTTKPVGKGTGLGLSVSHGIVRSLGGDIRVKSTAGKGASFFISIPLTEQDK